MTNLSLLLESDFIATELHYVMAFLDVTKEPTKHRTSCTQESANDVCAVGRVPDQPGLAGASVQDE